MREMVEVVQADSRHDHLDFRAAVPRSEPLDELPFAGSARSKIGVAALGGRWHEVAPVVEQERLARARPGRQQRGVAAQVRRAGLQHVELLGMEHGDENRDRHQVVQQADSRDPNSSATALPSTVHDTLVSSAASSSTGPATPKQAASTEGSPAG